MGGLSLGEEVLIKSGRRCCICYGLYGDLQCKRGQIAHLDHNHQNNVFENLAFICLQHHDEYDSRTSQSKGWKIREVKHYRAKLYETIENLRLESPQQTISLPKNQYQLPIVSKILGFTRMMMDVVDYSTGEKYSSIPAYSLLHPAQFLFDITNPNRFDITVISFYIDVIKFVPAKIIGIWEGDRGGGMRVREFACNIEPVVGRYKCTKTSDTFDYIRLSEGETEVFRLYVEAVTEGIYWLRLGIEYSIGGLTNTLEIDNDIAQIGVFDPVFHTPSYDLSTRLAEESDTLPKRISLGRAS